MKDVYNHKTEKTHFPMFSSHPFSWFKEEMCPHFTISPHWNILSQLVVLLGKFGESLGGGTLLEHACRWQWALSVDRALCILLANENVNSQPPWYLLTPWLRPIGKLPHHDYFSSPSRTVKSKSTPLSYQLPWSCCTQLATATGKIMKMFLFSDPSNSRKRILSGDTLGLMSRLKWNVSSEASILWKTMLQISFQKVACVKHIRW